MRVSRIIRISTFLLIIFLVPLDSFAQTKSEKDKEFIMYERGFKFKEGIYFNFNDFHSNQPSIEAKVEERDGVLYYFSDSSNSMIPFNKVHWGYNSGKNAFVYTGHGHSRLAVIGSLCYFAVVYSSAPSPTVAVASGGGFGMGMSTGSQGSLEYMIDMKTGKLIPFNKKNMVKLLEERDEVLLKEFKKQKGRKDVRLHYILNAYNSYHPLFFPVD